MLSLWINLLRLFFTSSSRGNDFYSSYIHPVHCALWCDCNLLLWMNESLEEPEKESSSSSLAVGYWALLYSQKLLCLQGILWKNTAKGGLWICEWLRMNAACKLLCFFKIVKILNWLMYTSWRKATFCFLLCSLFSPT